MKPSRWARPSRLLASNAWGSWSVPELCRLQRSQLRHCSRDRSTESCRRRLRCLALRSSRSLRLPPGYLFPVLRIRAGPLQSQWSRSRRGGILRDGIRLACVPATWRMSSRIRFTRLL